jgi:hypothetical protein
LEDFCFGDRITGKFKGGVGAGFRIQGVVVYIKNHLLNICHLLIVRRTLRSVTVMVIKIRHGGILCKREKLKRSCCNHPAPTLATYWS